MKISTAIRKAQRDYLRTVADYKSTGPDHETGKWYSVLLAANAVSVEAADFVRWALQEGTLDYNLTTRLEAFIFLDFCALLAEDEEKEEKEGE